MKKNERTVIHYLPREALEHDEVLEVVYRDLEHTHYWSDCWEPDFYVALARAGFISVATTHPELGPVLIPEMQEAWSVLDWGRVHGSRKLRKLLRSQRLKALGPELRIVSDCRRVLDRLVEYHAPDCWLEGSYRSLMERLPSVRDPHFALHGVELWSSTRGELVAGELGYTVGRTYTSLSGFCVRHAPEWRHFGTLQLWWLAERLQQHGYAFWNLGQPMAYKAAFGGRLHSRRAFLRRWLQERDGSPRRILGEAEITPDPRDRRAPPGS